MNLSFGHCILRLSGCPPLTSSNFSGEENETINIQIRVFIVLKVVYLSQKYGSGSRKEAH
jgi:hypothetical protein